MDSDDFETKEPRGLLFFFSLDTHPNSYKRNARTCRKFFGGKQELQKESDTRT